MSNTTNLKKYIMKDLQILKQLLNGHHLEPKEIEQAKKVLNRLNIELKNRL
jgi:hypothetical protein